MGAYTNLQNLVNKFAAPLGGQLDKPSMLNRYAGGHARHNQPYVSGYWYLLMQPPVALLGADINADATTWLHATAESFTPPTKTVTKADVPGMGGVASSFVAGQELSRTFTVAFREWQGLPVMNIIQAWTNAIESRSGISPLVDFAPYEYKGAAYAALCRPTVSGTTLGTITQNNIEQLFYFEGVFPETLPYDSLTSDIATNDTAQLSVTFSFDGWPATRENIPVVEEFISLATQYGLTDENIGSHLANADPVVNSVFGGGTNGNSLLQLK